MSLEGSFLEDEQLSRNSSTVPQVLSLPNVAEGAGEFAANEKARFYRMARRSAIEIAAWVDITERRGEASKSLAERALQEVEIVVAMLVKLVRTCER